MGASWVLPSVTASTGHSVCILLRLNEYFGLIVKRSTVARSPQYTKAWALCLFIWCSQRSKASPNKHARNGHNFWPRHILLLLCLAGRRTDRKDHLALVAAMCATMNFIQAGHRVMEGLLKNRFCFYSHQILVRPQSCRPYLWWRPLAAAQRLWMKWATMSQTPCKRALVEWRQRHFEVS